MHLSVEHDLDKNSNILLILLIFTDIVFVALHCFHFYTGLLPGALFSLVEERGYAEYFQHIKEFWIILLLFFLSVTKLNFLFLGWSLLFGYVLMDDTFQLHERLGELLATQYEIQSRYGLFPGDIGQLLVLASAGLALFSIIGIFHYASDAHDRKISYHLVVLMAILVVFGIGMDMLGTIFAKFGIWFRIPGLYMLVEESGEMIVMSVITWYVYGINASGKREI